MKQLLRRASMAFLKDNGLVECGRLTPEGEKAVREQSERARFYRKLYEPFK